MPASTPFVSSANKPPLELNFFWFCFSVLLYTPLLVIYFNEDAACYYYIQLLIPFAICIVSFFVSLLIMRCNKYIRVPWQIFFGFLSFYILFVTNFYPVQTQIFDDSVNLSFYAHHIFLVLCFLFFIFFRTASIKALRFLGIFSLVCFLYFMIFAQFIGWKQDKKIQLSRVQLGKSDNIIVLIMDGFQGYFVNEFLRNHPEISDELNGFISYTNAVSVAPMSAFSTYYLLTGEELSQKEGRLSAALLAKKDDTLFHDLKDLEYHIVCESMVGNVEGVKQLNYYNYPDASSRFFGFALRICSARYYPSKLFTLLFSLRKSILHGLSEEHMTFEPGQRVEQDSFLVFLRKAFRAFDFDNTAKEDIRDSIIEFSDRFIVEDSIGKAFVWNHSLLTHTPVRFDKDGNYSAKRKSSELYGEIHFAFKQLLHVFNRLKELGHYDNSTIIIMADHGFNLLFDEAHSSILPFSESASGLRDNKIGFFPSGQYDVSFLVKPKSSKGELRYNHSAVAYTDFRKTINVIANSPKAADFFGVDMLSDNLSNEREVDVMSLECDRVTIANYNHFDYWRPKRIRLPLVPTPKDTE